MSDSHFLHPRNVQQSRELLYKVSLRLNVVSISLLLLQRAVSTVHVFNLELLFSVSVTLTLLYLLSSLSVPDRELTMLSMRRISLFTAILYIFLRLVHSTGLYPVDHVFQLGLVGAVAVTLLTGTLVLHANENNLSPSWRTAIQTTFVLSLVVLALATTSTYPPLNRVLRSHLTKILTAVACTGVISLFAVRSVEPKSKLLAPEQIPFYDGSIPRRPLILLTAFIVLCNFVYARLQYLSKPFGGAPHSDKYGTHVPVMQNMLQANNPFHYENPGSAFLYGGQDWYTFQEFPELPWISWTTLPFLQFKEHLGLEFLVRSVLTVQGILLLLVLFFLLRELYDAELAIYGILLLSVNPIFNTITYITQTDLPAVLFTVTSLVLYLRGNKTYSYLFCGLAAVTKYSFLLISVPAISVIVLMNEDDWFYELVKQGYFVFTTMILWFFLLKPAAGSSIFIGLLHLLSFGASILGNVVLFRKYDQQFEEHLMRLGIKSRYVITILTPLVSIAALHEKIIKYAPAFLTDRYLIFNAGMYANLLEMFKENMPDMIYYLFPLGLFWILLEGDRKERSIILGIMSAAVFYTVIASKSVYIHMYYKHVQVLVFIVGFIGIFDALRRFRLPSGSLSVICVSLVLLLAVSSQATTTTMLGDRFRGTEEMGKYIEHEVSDSEIVLQTQTFGGLIPIYSETPVSYPPAPGWYLNDLRSKIDSKGFGTALRTHNVTYYVSLGPANFEAFEYLLADEYPTTSRRESILRETVPGYQPERAPTNIPTPEEHFQLVKQSGDWYLYKIVEEDNSSGGRQH